MKDKPLTGQQLKFCKYLADGDTQTRAYRRAYKGCKSDESAGVCAVKLLGNAKVSQKVKDLQKASEARDVLTRQEKRKFLADVLRVNVDDLSDEKYRHLIQERTRTVTSSGGKKETLKMPSKLDAIKEDNKMAGDYEPEKIEVDLTERKETPFMFTRRKIKEQREAEAEDAEGS